MKCEHMRRNTWANYRKYQNSSEDLCVPQRRSNFWIERTI